MKMLEKIEEARKRIDLKQAELERAAFLAQGRISKWKDEKGEPSARQLLRIADILGVSMRWLVDDDMEVDQIVEKLSSAEIAVLTAYRASGLDSVLAVRSLMEAARRLAQDRQDQASGVEGYPVDLPSGLKLSPGPKRPGRKGSAGA
jgi:transcriptional regulator with XRE-family HTH domain